MNIETNQFLSSMQVKDNLLKGKSRIETSDFNDGLLKTHSFEDILKEKVSEDRGEVKFSKHALSRLETRNITLSDGQMSRLNEGTKQAYLKGIKDSLVMVDELAFIVNVPNNTVVTAIDSNESEDKIFTNIDGAVIA